MMTDKTPMQVLTDARALIANPAHWTQNAHARDAVGNSTHWDSPDAACFCAIGAIMRVTGAHLDDVRDMHPVRTAYYLLGNASSKTGDFAVADFNDSATHDQVVALFDQAIERAAA